MSCFHTHLNPSRSTANIDIRNQGKSNLAVTNLIDKRLLSITDWHFERSKLMPSQVLPVSFIGCFNWPLTRSPLVVGAVKYPSGFENHCAYLISEVWPNEPVLSCTFSLTASSSQQSWLRDFRRWGPFSALFSLCFTVSAMLDMLTKTNLTGY